MTRWDTLEVCREEISPIRSAIANFLNGRGGAVWAKDAEGIWRQLKQAKLDPQGNPTGTDDYERWFLLRAAEVRQ